ncbi:MAG: hypothetical protein AB8H80_12155 [Planctomycetota bacterium]
MRSRTRAHVSAAVSASLVLVGAAAAALCGNGLRAQERPVSKPDLSGASAAPDLERAVDLEHAIEALRGEDEVAASTAARTVRHEWAELPAALFQGIEGDARAARRLLVQFAQAPRPAARAWVQEQAEARLGRTLEHRLLAIAAKLDEPSRQEVALLLDAAQQSPDGGEAGGGGGGDGLWFAAARLTSKQADRLVGRMHQLLQAGEVTVARLGPLFDRLSGRGIKALLGLAVTLESEPSRSLLQHVHQLRPELVDERVAAQLDRDTFRDIEAAWLEFAPAALDRPARIERVLRMMACGATQAVRDAAFDALVAVRAVDGRMLQLALGEVVHESAGDAASGREWQSAAEPVDEATVLRRSLRLAQRVGRLVPAARIVDWLQSAPELAQATAQSLERRPVLEAEIEQHLLQMLDGLGRADQQTPRHALAALVRSGSATALAEVWPLVRSSESWGDLFDRLGRRKEPFVYEMLLAGIAEKAPQAADAAMPTSEVLARFDEQRDAMRFMLVQRGDRHELNELFAQIGKRDSVFVGRAAQHVRRATVAQAKQLYDAALAAEDGDAAVEMFEWAVQLQPDASQAWLWQLWLVEPETDTVYELQEAAIRLLARGPRREELLAELRQAMATGPLPDRMASLPYEAINGIPMPAESEDGIAATPMSSQDLTLCAELLLRMSLADPDGAARRAMRWPNGTSGYPLVQAIGHRLRHEDVDVLTAERAFAAVVGDVSEHEGRANVTPQRLKVLWRALARRRDLQHALGAATVALSSSPEGAGTVFPGAAHYLRAVRSRRQGDLAAAEVHFRNAVQTLLRLPAGEAELRWLVGERDVAGGVDPAAALAAAPYLMRLLAARKAGDDDAARAAASLVREFAGRDGATLAFLTASDSDRDNGR